jgi:hypothetical protein
LVIGKSEMSCIEKLRTLSHEDCVLIYMSAFGGEAHMLPTPVDVCCRGKGFGA